MSDTLTETDSLFKLMRSVLDENPDADAETVAKQTLALMSSDDYEFYLRTVIEKYLIHTVRANIRNAAIKSVNTEISKVVIDDSVGVKKSYTTFSPKVNLIKSGWQKYLDSTISTDRGIVLLRNATISDLRLEAQKHYSYAESVKTNGKKYESLANALEAKGLTTLGLLPEDEGTKLI